MKLLGTRTLVFCFSLAAMACAGAESLKDVSFQDCVAYLWRNGVPVSCIVAPVSSKSEGITVQERINSLKQQLASLPEGDPSIVSLKQDLDQWSAYLSDDATKEKNILGYRSPRKDVDISASGDSTALKALLDAFPEYLEMARRDSIVLVPRNSPLLARKISFEIKDREPFEVVKELNSLLQKEFNAGIRFGAGGYAQRVKMMEIFDPSKRVTLDLEDVDIVDLLSRFAASLGPDTVWSLRTVDGSSVIMFERVHR